MTQPENNEEHFNPPQMINAKPLLAFLKGAVAHGEINQHAAKKDNQIAMVEYWQGIIIASENAIDMVEVLKHSNT